MVTGTVHAAAELDSPSNQARTVFTWASTIARGLGFDNGAQFDPARFDPAEANQPLTAMSHAISSAPALTKGTVDSAAAVVVFTWAPAVASACGTPRSMSGPPDLENRSFRRSLVQLT